MPTLDRHGATWTTENPSGTARINVSNLLNQPPPDNLHNVQNQLVASESHFICASTYRRSDRENNTMSWVWRGITKTLDGTLLGLYSSIERKIIGIDCNNKEIAHLSVEGVIGSLLGSLADLPANTRDQPIHQ